MFLVVGLGNPGREYENTRHNIGFKVVDWLSTYWKLDFTKKFQGLFAHSAEKSLLKPQTFMNLSGKSVREVVSFYKIEPQNCLVVYDDIDLPICTLRLRKHGGSGGHNGMKSVIEALGTEDFPRLRIGVGRDAQARDHVLGKIPKAEQKLYDEIIAVAGYGIELVHTEGIDKAMNEVNSKREDNEP